MNISTSTLTSRRRRQRVAGVALPDAAAFVAKVRTSFARLRERFISVYDSAWMQSPQSDHLLAYATWNEMLADLDGGDTADRQ
jgi:hypothetical protein